MSGIYVKLIDLFIHYSKDRELHSSYRFTVVLAHGSCMTLSQISLQNIIFFLKCKIYALLEKYRVTSGLGFNHRLWELCLSDLWCSAVINWLCWPPFLDLTYASGSSLCKKIMFMLLQRFMVISRRPVCVVSPCVHVFLFQLKHVHLYMHFFSLVWYVKWQTSARISRHSCTEEQLLHYTANSVSDGWM